MSAHLDPNRAGDPRREALAEMLAVLEPLITQARRRQEEAEAAFREHLGRPAPGPDGQLTPARVRFFSERDRRRCEVHKAMAALAAYRDAGLELVSYFTLGPGGTAASDLREDR